MDRAVWSQELWWYMNNMPEAQLRQYLFLLFQPANPKNNRNHAGITICSHWFVDMLQRNTRQNHQQHEQRQRCCHPRAPTIIIPTLAETAITTSNSKHQSTSWDSPLKSFWNNLKTNLFFQLLTCPDRALVPRGFRGSWAGNGHGGANVVVVKSRSKTVAKGGGRIKWSSSIIAKAAGNWCCKCV